MIGRLDRMKDHLTGIWEGSSSEAFVGQYEEIKLHIDHMACSSMKFLNN